MCTVVIILYVIEYVCTSFTEKKKKSNRNLSVFELKFPDLFIFVLFLHNYPWQL